MVNHEPTRPRSERAHNLMLYRSIAAMAVVVLVSAYTFAVVSGNISASSKINAADLAVLAIAAITVTALLSPETFRRLQVVQLGELKIELREVKATQDTQAERLHEIGLILSILLPENERNHLVNLADGKTNDYHGGQPMRTELRRLRSMGLLTMQPGQIVESMRSNMAFDLAAYVTLTKLGAACVSKIKEVDKVERPPAVQPAFVQPPTV